MARCPTGRLRLNLGSLRDKFCHRLGHGDEQTLWSAQHKGDVRYFHESHVRHVAPRRSDGDGLCPRDFVPRAWYRSLYCPDTQRPDLARFYTGPDFFKCLFCCFLDWNKLGYICHYDPDCYPAGADTGYSYRPYDRRSSWRRHIRGSLLAYFGYFYHYQHFLFARSPPSP